MEVVSDSSTHLISNLFLEKSSSSTSENDATSNLECGTTKVANISNSNISQDVHYSKPIFVTSLPLKKINSPQSSNFLPLIVDVNIDTPLVWLSVELHFCQNLLLLTSGFNILNTQPNNFEVSVSDTKFPPVLFSRRRFRFCERNLNMSDENKMTYSSEHLQCSHAV